MSHGDQIARVPPCSAADPDAGHQQTVVPKGRFGDCQDTEPKNHYAGLGSGDCQHRLMFSTKGYA